MAAKAPTGATAAAPPSAALMASSSAEGSSDDEASVHSSTASSSSTASASAGESPSDETCASRSVSSNGTSASDADNDDDPSSLLVPPSGDASAVELTKLRLQREQRLRRLLSQRHLGQPEPVSPNALFGTRSALSEEDTVWLYSLTNAACFERLVAQVQGTAAALAGNLDAVLASANPLFHFNYRMPVTPAEHAESGVGAVALREAAEMQRWRAETPAVVRKKRTREDGAAAAARDGAHGSAGRQFGKRARTSASGAAVATTGLVAQSMKAWEAHLSASLTAEGETIDHFRQSRTKSSFTDKKKFQERAAWQEYRHEVRLQTEQRERELKRAMRRGETEGV